MAKPSRWQKLKRGEAQTKTVDDEIEDFMSNRHAHPIHISDKLDAERKAWVVRIDSVPDLPEHWGLTIGEAVHNLRGALDHLMWDLAIVHNRIEPLDTKGRYWRTQFPICAVPDDWKSSGIRNMVQPLSDGQRAEIELLQPYRGWDGPPPRPHPLAALEDLSNTDKHHSLQPVLLSVGGMEINMRAVRDCFITAGVRLANLGGKPLNAGTELLVVPLNIQGPDPHVDVQPNFQMRVALMSGMGVPETLGDICTFTRKALNIFEGYLSTPEALEIRERVDLSHPIAPGSETTVTWIPEFRAAEP